MTDQELAKHMRQVAADEAERQANPKAGQTVQDDLDAIAYRVKTGLPKAPMQVWRY